MTKPLVSIGMIFKNEERCLERCLQSLEPLRRALPCELVMADTGSQDRSREIAAQYADVLFDFPWVNDFSAARNAVLDRCSGKWYFTLDADEWLCEDIRELIAFLTLEHNNQVGTFRVRNYQFEGREQFVDSWAVRILLRSTGARYQYPIHESFEITEMRKVSLEDFFLHHDGYRQDFSPEQMQEKQLRNITMLEVKLKNDPTSLHTITECIESCKDPQKSKEYVDMGLALVAQGVKDDFLPSLYRYAVWTANQLFKPDEALRYLAEGYSHVPNSIFLRLDGEASAMLAMHTAERWEESRQHGERWMAAQESFDRGEVDLVEQRYGTLIHSGKRSNAFLYTTMFFNYGQLRRWDQAENMAQQLDFSWLEGENIRNFAHALLDWAEHLSNAPTILRRLWDAGSHDAESDIAPTLMGLFDHFCSKNQTPAIRAMADMGICDPAIVARIILAENAAEAMAALSGLWNWGVFLAPAYRRLMELGAVLPASFFSRTSEELAETAVALARVEHFGAALLTYLQAETGEDPGRLLWKIDLVASALQCGAWESDEEAEALWDAYLRLEGRYLETTYKPALLQEETLSVLPAVHRFAFYAMRADELRRAGRWTDFAQMLHAALQTSPAMKEIVSFWLDRLEQISKAQEAEAELLQLAEQVRAILTQLPPDSPDVLALRQSPAFRAVAHLIEEPGTIH